MADFCIPAGISRAEWNKMKTEKYEKANKDKLQRLIVEHMKATTEHLKETGEYIHNNEGLNMSSTKTLKWKRVLFKVAPFLFVTCPEYNWHWRWDKYCHCGNEIISLKTGMTFSRDIWENCEKIKKERIELKTKIRKRKFQ